MNSIFFLSLSVIAISFLSGSSLAGDISQFKIDLGEKLFLEERFSYSFYLHSRDRINKTTQYSDPALKWGEIFEDDKYLPTFGQHYSCATCHLVDQMGMLPHSLVYTYNDPFKRSPKPYRFEKLDFTIRNSMNSVASMLKKDQPLHWDGEYFSPEELTCDGLTGGNMGWKLDEYSVAIQHIASVIKKDDGSYSHRGEINENYSVSFSKLGFDVKNMKNEEVFQSVCHLISDFMRDIDFARSEDGEYEGSAYDQFLHDNNLPKSPSPGESNLTYSKRIQELISKNKKWTWVQPTELKYHESKRQFGREELEGLKIFLGKANCIHCHQAPLFTDSGFHNVGISQLEYEKLHGKGSFQKMNIPNYSFRLKSSKESLIATRVNSSRVGTFRKQPAPDNKAFVDLGVWNIMLHPEKGHVQALLKNKVCHSVNLTKDCSDWSNDQWLGQSVALFKTPTLRSLGQSEPYFHSGAADDIFDVLATYMATSRKARRGEIVNVDPQLKKVHIEPNDLHKIEAFLNSLNEDYD